MLYSDDQYNLVLHLSTRYSPTWYQSNPTTGANLITMLCVHSTNKMALFFVFLAPLRHSKMVRPRESCARSTTPCAHFFSKIPCPTNSGLKPCLLPLTS
uniref:Uncharacterized protein n=1 Tax=Arundo donax TaxID=35708 RepID=A0A0A9G5H1_ARUDO